MEAIGEDTIWRNFKLLPLLQRMKTESKMYYPKPEADAEIKRLKHQISVLNADLTRCQEAKTAIGDKCLRLEAEVYQLNNKYDSVWKKLTDHVCGGR